MGSTFAAFVAVLLTFFLFIFALFAPLKQVLNEIVQGTKLLLWYQLEVESVQDEVFERGVELHVPCSFFNLLKMMVIQMSVDSKHPPKYRLHHFLEVFREIASVDGEDVLVV